MKTTTTLALSLSMITLVGCGGGSDSAEPVIEETALSISVGSMHGDNLGLNLFFEELENGYDHGKIAISTDLTGTDDNISTSYEIECDGDGGGGTTGVRCDSIEQVDFYFIGYTGSGNGDMAEFWCEYYLKPVDDVRTYQEFQRQTLYVPAEENATLLVTLYGQSTLEDNSTVSDVAHNSAVDEVTRTDIYRNTPDYEDERTEIIE